MNQILILYGLRLFSGFMLLLFIAYIAWLVSRDLRFSTSAVKQNIVIDQLRVIASDNESLGINTLFPLLPVTSIGRIQNNTIIIDDGFISGRHALITLREQQWWIEDLGSRNGTFLNDLPLSEPTVVSSGDVIMLGGTQLKFEQQMVS